MCMHGTVWQFMVSLKFKHPQFVVASYTMKEVITAAMQTLKCICVRIIWFLHYKEGTKSLTEEEDDGDDEEIHILLLRLKGK